MLNYVLDLAPVEQQLARQCYQMGEPLPERIAKAPELTQGLELYLSAFFELDSERKVGFSVGRIGWLSIKEYAFTFEFDDVQTEDLMYFVKEMDKAYLEHVRLKLKDNSK